MSLNPDITDPKQVADMARQKMSCNPLQREAGQGALAYAIKHHPKEVAASLKTIEETLATQDVETIKSGLIAVLREAKITNPKEKEAIWIFAKTTTDKDVQGAALECYHEVSKFEGAGGRARDPLPTPVQSVALPPDHDGPHGSPGRKDEPVALTIASSASSDPESGIVASGGRAFDPNPTAKEERLDPLPDPPAVDLPKSQSIESAPVAAAPGLFDVVLERLSPIVPLTLEVAPKHKAEMAPISIATGQTPTEPSTGLAALETVSGTAPEELVKEAGAKETAPNEPVRDPVRPQGLHLGDQIRPTATGDEDRVHPGLRGSRRASGKPYGATPGRLAKLRAEEVSDPMMPGTPLPIFVPTFPPVIQSPPITKNFAGAGKRGQDHHRDDDHHSDRHGQSGRGDHDNDRDEQQPQDQA